MYKTSLEKIATELGILDKSKEALIGGASGLGAKYALKPYLGKILGRHGRVLNKLPLSGALIGGGIRIGKDKVKNDVRKGLII